ncbi:hypothetical protein [Thalassolituus pacificus]|jgi:hypothetical protein|uniref:Uncharacterized protein n=1 Tax=Thalassolituus pacificus TaxID=2975440 RepID=A0A9X2WHW1_9GAMM|nr:hypothetical protein [Thalassolituus pacificus]MCT7360660.1 hypothetical protein [Thalassolituus pacificus]
MKIRFLPSDWLGLAAGTVAGLIQGITIFSSNIILHTENTPVLPGVFFGLFAPAILALFSKIIPLPAPATNQKIGRYINMIFFMITFGIFTGISGFGYYLFVNGDSSAIPILSFFGSAGIGFIFAYLINPELAFRPASNLQTDANSTDR